MASWQQSPRGASLGTMMPFSETLFIRETVEEDEILHYQYSDLDV
jgi:hypothetical protein